jgi:hypothetical protein
MAKKNTIASKMDKSWTVLLVNGQGRIRRIRNFRRKLGLLVGFSTGALALAGIMAILYGGMLHQQKTFSDEIDRLTGRIAALQQQNELLKVRAVRLEAQASASGQTTASNKALTASAPKSMATPPQTTLVSRGPVPEQPKAPAAPADTPTEVDTPAEADEKAEAPEARQKHQPQVDAVGLKVDYQAQTETIAAQFVIKNTGQGQAGGRSVVVLQTEDGRSQLHFALPSVPLKEGRPIGNRGRRFSISRFMTMKLERRFAEPGTRFVRAVVYAYTLDGRPLLDKTFDVDLVVPEKEAPPKAPGKPLPTAAPLGLSLPAPETETPAGVQP